MESTPPADRDLGLQQRWLEESCADLLPTECAASVQRYDQVDFAFPPVTDTALANAVPKRQREFSAGRAAARTALAKLRITDQAIPVGPNRNPLWPAGITGSIAHTAGLAVAVLAHSNSIGALGIDLEIADAVQAGLWRAILTKAEIEQVTKIPENRQPSLATLIFCAKESFYKMQHPVTGLWLDVHDAEVRATPETGSFELTCTATEVTTRLGRAEFSGRCASNRVYTFAAMYLSATGNPGLA